MTNKKIIQIDFPAWNAIMMCVGIAIKHEPILVGELLSECNLDKHSTIKE